MGFLDKTTQTVTAHFTKKGREILANALSGDAENDESYVITKFALSDDEVDYGLWDENQPSNLKGRIIENMPVIEGFLNQKEIMNSLITDPPPLGSFGPVISNLQEQILLEGKGDFIDISPVTENVDVPEEEYEFFLEHDNLFDMIQPWFSPIADFLMELTDAGESNPDLPPVAGFSWNVNV